MFLLSSKVMPIAELKNNAYHGVTMLTIVM